MVNEPKFEYFQDKSKNSEWRWHFKASNSKIIAMSSESYNNEADCLHSIDIIKKESSTANTHKI
jgi:uncharacterized protein YegP (UPF0339 family)